MMDLDEFTLRNIKRCTSKTGFNHRIHDWTLSDWTTALVGEIGEAANVIKKMNRHRDGIQEDLSMTQLREQLADELADAFIYLNLLMIAAGFDPSTIVEAKFQKVSNKIGYTE